MNRNKFNVYKSVCLIVRCSDVSFLPKAINGVITSPIILNDGYLAGKLYLTPSKTKQSVTTEGDEDAKKITQKLEGSYPGDDLIASEFVQNNIGNKFLIFMTTCYGKTLLFGSCCSGLEFTANQIKDNKQTIWKMTFYNVRGMSSIPVYYEAGFPQTKKKIFDLTFDLTFE